VVAARYIGQSVPRIEDDRVLTGRGRYVGDISLPGMVHAVFVRSPLAHATVNGIDADAARAMPGVVAVLTADDLALNPLQIGMEVPGYHRPVFGVLAADRVRFAGDPVAVVIAETRAAAEDARDMVFVDYEPLDAVATVEQALDPAVPPLFADVDSNVFYDETWEFGDPAAAFEGARVVSMSLRPQRVSQVPMEGRAGLADFDPGTGELTYYAANQAPHGLRFNLALLLGHPADRLRVIAPDVGGAFGQKAATFREDLIVCAASKLLGRPVKWLDDRMENMSAATHARDERIEISAAVEEDGTILALDVKMTLDQGAYPAFPVPSTIFGWAARTYIPASYRVKALRFAYTIVATNKASYGAYRGPWAVETLARELLVEQIARELGLDPVDVRRKNLYTADEQPTKMISGPTLMDVTSLESVDRAAELLDYAAFREEQQRAREQGRLLGIGFSTYIEAAPGPPDFFDALGFQLGGERAIAKLEPDGRLTILTAQAPHGQGHETTIAQVAATEFGVPIEHVRVVHGDTRDAPFSTLGTGGSRAGTMASGAALHATRAVKQKVLNLAGTMLEIAPDDLEIVDAMVTPKGAPAKAMPLAQVAMAAHFMPAPGEEPDFRSTAVFNGSERGGWSGGTHACIVEVDPETGDVKIERYLVVEDCGQVINPAIVDGQVRGGVAQGIGIALYEHAAYDEEGNFLAGTFMEYLVPTAMEIPHIEIDHMHVESHEEVDYRGVGEGGTVAAPAAVLNAIADAVGGKKVTQLPLTPERVLELLEEG
jgi:aerobic carbon-monoxide dehydrogenase large subunit